MAAIFTLTQPIKDLATNALDSLIRELGKDCLLVYSPKMEYCPNCTFDPQSKRSSNIWKSGGPAPFPSGALCSLCNGKGQRANQVTKLIRLLCHSNIKKFINLPPQLEIPDGTIQTKGHISDLEFVLQAEEMIVQPDLSPYIKWRYKLWGEIINPSNIISNRYWSGLWRRIPS